jgi:hypothetical protein
MLLPVNHQYVTEEDSQCVSQCMGKLIDVQLPVENV